MLGHGYVKSSWRQPMGELDALLPCSTFLSTGEKNDACKIMYRQRWWIVGGRVCCLESSLLISHKHDFFYIKKTSRRTYKSPRWTGIHAWLLKVVIVMGLIQPVCVSALLHDYYFFLGVGEERGVEWVGGVGVEVAEVIMTTKEASVSTPFP